MTLWQKIRSQFTWTQRWTQDPDGFMHPDTGEGDTSSGPAGGLRTIPVAEACISRLSDGLTCLPKHVGIPPSQVDRRGEGARARPYDLDRYRLLQADHTHPVSRLLANPSRVLDPDQFWQWMFRGLYSEGNSFAWIRTASIVTRMGRNLTVATELVPAQLGGIRWTRSGNLEYDLNLWQGFPQGGRMGASLKKVPASEVIHLSYKASPGMISASPIQHFARQVLMAQSGGLSVHNAALRKGLLQRLLFLPQSSRVTEDQRTALIKALGLVKGVKGAGGGAVFPPDIDAKVLGSISTIDGTVLDVMRFTVEDVCRVFGVPPRMVGHYHTGMRAAGKPEEQATDFVKYSLMPEAHRIASQLGYKLLTPEQRRDGLMIELPTAMAALGTMTETVGALGTAVSDHSLLTPNEGRVMLGYPPIEGQDELLTPRGGPPEGPGNPAAPPDPDDGDEE